MFIDRDLSGQFFERGTFGKMQARFCRRSDFATQYHRVIATCHPSIYQYRAYNAPLGERPRRAEEADRW